MIDSNGVEMNCVPDIGRPSSRFVAPSYVNIPDPFLGGFVGDICSSKPQKGGTRFFMIFVSPGSPKSPGPPFWAHWQM